MKSLYKIGEDMSALDELLEELGGDVSDEAIDAAIQEWLEENQSNLAVKTDNIVIYVKELQARAKSKKEMAKEYAQSAKFDERKAERMKKRLMDFMQERGIPKLQGNLHTVAIQQNGGKEPVILDEEIPIEEVPEEYLIQPPKVINKEALYNALVAGVKLKFAKLGARGFHPRLK